MLFRSVGSRTKSGGWRREWESKLHLPIMVLQSLGDQPVPSSAKVTPRRYSHPRLWLLAALQTSSNTHEKTSLDLANYVKSMPSAFRVRPGSIPAGGDSGVWNGIGVPAAGSLLFYFCR